METWLQCVLLMGFVIDMKAMKTCGAQEPLLCGLLWARGQVVLLLHLLAGMLLGLGTLKGETCPCSQLLSESPQHSGFYRVESLRLTALKGTQGRGWRRRLCVHSSLEDLPVFMMDIFKPFVGPIKTSIVCAFYESLSLSRLLEVLESLGPIL